ncbi:helix-turn-helix domain-containing protein [Clostridium tyrobutyricum]|uniref:helix-turn-helix domain-containing protein n=1 Tax=Clostridium tyrobutyricum TaxID=1519 RepID=UPI001C3844E0|nr:helix-turn-helix domain-containing protein [Clostridium tyrobutyricum]MBV4422957.1 helix-turn-helix domain-containing protein [Clostridium tyrobutyricum]
MYGEIIRNLRKEHKLTQLALAKLLNFRSSSAIGMIEREERELNLDTLNKLSKIFNVSTDYILGNTSERFPGEIDKLDEEIKALYPKIKKLSKEDRQKILDIIKNAGL